MAKDIRALTFDTGGTILDWHSGFVGAMANTNPPIPSELRPKIANEIRKRTLARMLNLGREGPPTFNFDDAHRAIADDVLAEFGFSAINTAGRAPLYNAIYNLVCWPDFPSVLPKLRQGYICVSLTILSFRIIIENARRNGLSWDTVFSCEAFGKYKLLPEAYETAARLLQLKPQQCCMVACHNFDLDAARVVGFRTAFVRRPDEWGPAGPPDPEPNPAHDFIVDDFAGLAEALGVEL